ncbi:MAG: glucokinase [Sphingomonas bacterium]|nr:glucokinase [Sphingomonas bacterium]
MKHIVTADIGGTHARFALATIERQRVSALAEPLTLRTGEFASLATAWAEFGRHVGEALPREAAIAFAGPVGGDLLKLTNNPWVIRPADIANTLGVDRHLIVNDFGAIAHAVAGLDASAFSHVCGHDEPLPEAGMITIIGPGTGLGVAALLRRPGDYDAIETEGGHIDYAPLDAIEDQILAHLRTSFRRVSVERLVAGSGLVNIYAGLAAIEQRPMLVRDDKALWAAALDGSDPLATAALDRFCLIFGAVAGDLALAHGAHAVVIAGGLGLRLKDHLPRSGFASRFIAKGRFERRMEALPVKLITYPQPGLFGAAAAFARHYGEDE